MLATMRLEDLDIFRAVHETGGFQRAAQRVGLTQSAVTKIVRKLEAEFGLPLIERGARSVALTPGGRTLYDRCVEMHELAAAIHHDMAGAAAARQGTIRLGVVPALLNTVVTPVLAGMMHRTSAVRLAVSAKLSGELVRMVDDGLLDIALCFEIPVIPEDIVTTCVGCQHYRLVVRQGHPLAGHSPTLQELSQFDWLLPTRDVALRVGIDRLFAEAGLGDIHVQVEIDTSGAQFVPLLLLSNLVTVLAEQTLRPLTREGLVVLDVDLDALSGRVAIYHRRTTPSTGLLMDLKHRLEDKARQNFPAGRS